MLDAPNKCQISAARAPGPLGDYICLSRQQQKISFRVVVGQVLQCCVHLQYPANDVLGGDAAV